MIKHLNKLKKYIGLIVFTFLFFLAIVSATFAKVNYDKTAIDTELIEKTLYKSASRIETLSFNNVNKMHYLIIGNSITKHGINSDWPIERGMAATENDKDYVHVLEKLFKADGISDVKYTIEPYNTTSIKAAKEFAQTNLKTISGHSLDLIILQIGENIINDAPLSDYLEVVKEMITDLKEQVPRAEIFFIDSMFKNPINSDALSNLVDSMGAVFVPIDKIKEDGSYRSYIGDTIYDNEGNAHKVINNDVAFHPNDKGHEYIANQIHNYYIDNIILKKQSENNGRTEIAINNVPKNDYLNSVENLGDTSRVGKFLKRARAGENLTVLGFGGSITAGAGLISTKEDISYGKKVTNWLEQKYPQSNFKYINAGLSGTNLTYSVFRVKEDVLKYNPDLVILDYSVNTRGDTDVKNLYSSIVSQINKANEETAMINIHFTETELEERPGIIDYSSKKGSATNQEISEAVVDFDLPSISYYSFINDKIEKNIITKNDIFQDYVHPTENGHLIAANLITNLLGYIDMIYQGKEAIIKPMKKLASDPYANYEYITFEGNGGGKSKERGRLYFGKHIVEGNSIAYKGWMSYPTEKTGLLDFDIVDAKKVVIGFQFTNAEGESITFAKMDKNGKIDKLGEAVAPEVGLFSTVTYKDVGDYLGIMTDLPKGYVVIYGIGILK